MSTKTLQNSILSTFALSVLLTATGCSIGGEQAELGPYDSGVMGDTAELEFNENAVADGPLDHIEASDAEAKIKVAGSSDKTIAPGVSVPEKEPEPEEAAPVYFFANYLEMVAQRIRYATPSEMGEINKDDFLGLSLANAVNTHIEPADPTQVTSYRYDPEARVFELTFKDSDNLNRGSMACGVKRWQSTAAHEVRFDCNFSIMNGGAEMSGKLNLSHERNSDTMRIMVASEDPRPLGTTELQASLYLENASDSCYTVTSNHRITTPNGILFAANMSDVLQCENRCQPESGEIELDIRAGNDEESYSLTGVSGDPWRMADDAGTSYDVASCH